MHLYSLPLSIRLGVFRRARVLGFAVLERVHLAEDWS
jgi:hypothetical protein